ncbi:MAG: AAA-like domain-containing protein [Cyanobacteria bacterium P01_D01_bin.44]
MAGASDYTADYLRNTAYPLWHLLSEFFDESITKTNLRSTLEPLPITPEQRQAIPQHTAVSTAVTALDFPDGPVPLDSHFYVERPPIEELAIAQISKPGSVLRIKAARRMGKSSLMLRITAQAAVLGYQIVMLDFQQAEVAIFETLDRFLRWVCSNVDWQLQLETRLDDYWNANIGSKVSCTLYFQGHLLAAVNSPVVLVLNETNRLFEHPQIAQEFLPLLRSWHEEARHVEVFQKLRLVIVHSTEVYIPLKLNQSPFNVGLALKLPPLTLEQVQDLAGRYGLDWATDTNLSDSPLQALTEMVGGHPYLLQIAFYYLCQGEMTLEQLLKTAPTLDGIYSSHLRHLWSILQAEPDLAAALKSIIKGNERMRLDPILTYRLESLGVVKLEGNAIMLGCELYRQYLSSQL